MLAVEFGHGTLGSTDEDRDKHVSGTTLAQLSLRTSLGFRV